MATQKYIVLSASPGEVIAHLAGFSAQRTVAVAEISRHHDHPLASGCELWCDDGQHWHDAPPEARREKS